jgi:hypothetical protein
MRTEITLNGICAALQRNCGDQYEACREVGVSPIFLEQWCKDDKKVAERVQEAARVGTMGLVSAAIKRAVHGVEEDVYFKGSVVGQKTNYSDSLLTTLLKAKVPEFHKDADGGGTTVNVQIANVMPRADSYEQWLEMKTRTVGGPAQSALAAPIEGTVIDVGVQDERDQGLEALSRIMCEPARENALPNLL